MPVLRHTIRTAVTTRSLLAVACGCAIACAAEQAVVTMVYSSQSAPYMQSAEGFRQRMQQRDVALLSYERQLSDEASQPLSAHLEQKGSKVAFALGTRAAELCRQQAGSVPVVFTMVLDADSFAGPTRTGVSLDIPAEQRVAVVARILPKARRAGVIYGPSGVRAFTELADACSSRGISVVSRNITEHSQFSTVLAEIIPAVDCFFMVPDPTVYVSASVEYLLRSSLEKNVPVIGLSSLYARAGALIAFDCDYRDIGRQSADLALRLINGESAGTIAPLRPSTQVVSLNVAVARRLGIVIPQAILDSAGAVYGR